MRVIVRKNEPIEKAMRRFKRKVESEGIMRDMKKKRYYKKPSVEKKEKTKAAEKRRRKLAKRQSKHK
jgi:small subunit ribosomal protein S21|tara:strand:+ start:778 stop:978 length:201 start_codon:yes stop_codon:yes gene_type:complete